ncbi:MAG: type II toxin-antitoxin system Phd/YefM family antitoxin [Chloroflexota bacterium]|nr:type II toxin-antitoxin system Phd/YefM family antitoxin [Chloroflexota bacterium]
MPKRVSATEAKTNLGAMMEWTVVESDDVIIETHGRPKAVLVSYPMYQEVRKIQETIRREQALAQMEALAATVQARNQDLSPVEAEATADRFTRDVVREMIADGQIVYQGS